MASLPGVGRIGVFSSLANPALPLQSPAFRPNRVSFPLAGRPSYSYSNARKATGKAMDSLNEGVEMAKQKTKEAADATSKKASEMMEGAKGTAQAVTDKTKETVDATSEKASEMMEGAKGTAKSAGEKAQQTVQEGWVEAQQTGQKIKEAVVGTSSE